MPKTNVCLCTCPNVYEDVGKSRPWVTLRLKVSCPGTISLQHRLGGLLRSETFLAFEPFLLSFQFSLLSPKDTHTDPHRGVFLYKFLPLSHFCAFTHTGSSAKVPIPSKDHPMCSSAGNGSLGRTFIGASCTSLVALSLLTKLIFLLNAIMSFLIRL